MKKILEYIITWILCPHSSKCYSLPLVSYGRLEEVKIPEKRRSCKLVRIVSFTIGCVRLAWIQLDPVESGGMVITWLEMWQVLHFLFWSFKAAFFESCIHYFFLITCLVPGAMQKKPFFSKGTLKSHYVI